MPSTTSDSGLLESSLSRTRSFIRTPSFIRTSSVINRQSLLVFSHKSAEPAPRPVRRPSHYNGQPVMVNAPSPTKSVKKRRSSNKCKATKRSGTILRAVPAATILATAPLSPLERDMATLPNQEILTSIGKPPSIDDHSSLNSAATARSPVQAGPEKPFFSNVAQVKGTIGHYKHGIIHWEDNDRASSAPLSPSSSKSRRPRIQVIIPSERLSRPLPSIPFFSSPTRTATQVRSASAEPAYTSDVSPPSVTGTANPKARNSMVSPLSAQQYRPQRQQTHLINTQVIPEIPSHVNAFNSSSEDSHGDDASSCYSQRSSVTSVESNHVTAPTKPINLHERSASATFSIKSPSTSGIFNDEARAAPKSVNASAETGPQVQPPTGLRPRRYAPHPPIEQDDLFVRTCALRPARNTSGNGLARQPSISLPKRQPSTRKSSRSSLRRSPAANPTMGVINEAITRSASKQISGSLSPTLSEAENDLEQELTSFTEENPFKWDEVIRKESGMDAASPPPLPRKSSKRHSQFVGDTFRMSCISSDHIVSQLKRNLSMKGLTLKDPQRPKRVTDNFSLSPIPAIPPKATRRNITADVADKVILSILQALESLDDLFAMAVLNKGFYDVYKRHELQLMKSILQKSSPPAWEHREICYPGHDEVEEDDIPRREYTPTTYLRYYTRDMYIIAALKSLIKEKCQSFMRTELSIALLSNDPAEAARVDDALWRIWTFCKIFGSGRGREDDIVAQMDWLKGGELVHQKTSTYSIVATEALDMNETLASAPECFAKGNEGGLTAEQLFDMMELWNCLGVLLQPFEGRTIQAREYGVFDPTDIRGGDIDGEEVMLDEWYYYLLTLGLSAILDLTAPCRQSDPSAFILASENGWTDWKPPMFDGSRRSFLKEAAQRVYEDKIAITYAESSTKEVQRQMSKQRMQRHIAEIRRRKDSGERLPEIRMSQERPMSEWEGVMDNLTRPRVAPALSIVTHIPQLRSAAPSSVLPTNAVELPAAPPTRPATPPRRVFAEPLLPTPPPSTVPSVADWDSRSRSSQWDTRSIAPSMPSIEEHPAKRHSSIPNMPSLEEHPAFARHLETMNRQVSPEQTRAASSGSPSAHSSTPSLEAHPVFQQHPLQREIMSSDAADNTADKAVYRIVEMGFTPEQARHALRITDLGDGLRVDRAVELLLREG
ncbi:hypothetical protein EJ04DRAFT_507558 [Polyplosphaeria fusca]|uniref:UBA domain-containing protein n=1 Tax=Polyplosphaeria fusca TaxID=682080 RepID=A0A9P4V7P5_9PLEO|nr:hypothetical protein EJ04DRAFT_507558 [Polyplosphaeria fusca]